MEKPIEARVLFYIGEDGEHANFRVVFDGPVPEAFTQWAKFAYCNDIVWRICSKYADGNDTFWGMVRRDLYKSMFRHIHDGQYLVPGAE